MGQRRSDRGSNRGSSCGADKEYVKRSDRGFLDRWVLRATVVLLCFLAVIQGLLRYDNLRGLLNESMRLEGEPLARAVAGLDRPAYPWLDTTLSDSEVSSGKVTEGVIYLRLLSKSKGKVWALVNGRAAKLVTEDDGALACQDGDLVEILCEKGEANVLVTYVSDNLSQPRVGVWVKGSGILLLSRVTVK